MTRAARALLAPGFATLLAFALLITLGMWQLRRLDQKEALIARIEARINAPVSDIPARDDWAKLAPTEYDFRHVRVEGRYFPEKEAFIFSQPPEGAGREPGYIVVTLLMLDTGGIVLVERGFIPASARDAAERYRPEAGPVAVTGVLHAPQTRNMFTPADDAAHVIFYTRDPLAIATALGVEDAAPFTLACAPGAVAVDALPRPFPGAPQLANNHLAYAFTWFSLAGAVLVIFALFARAKLMRMRGDVAA